MVHDCQLRFLRTCHLGSVAWSMESFALSRPDPAYIDCHLMECEMKIEFRGKVEPVYNHDNSLAYELIRCPVFATRHCDMQAFRFSKRYGGIANSTLFPAALARIRRDLGIKDYSPWFRLDQLPEGVTVDRSGFLAKVTVAVSDAV